MQSRRSFLAIPLAFATDWPQWRGPNRDGSIPAEPSKAWPERLKSVWSVTVGEGHASPVVVGNRVFQFARQGEQETILGLELETGKQLWKQSYNAPYEMNSAATGHGKGPKATPAVSDNRLYTSGINGMLSCWDVNSGKKLWDYNAQGSPEFGQSSSPVVDRGLLIASVGPQRGGALTGFDASTGKVRWQWKEDGPAYASPVITEIGGIRQAITNSQNNLVSVSVADGKSQWKLPLSTPYDQNAVTPIVVGDLVIYSGLSNPVTAIHPGPKPSKAWENKEVGMYMNSPVLASGVLWGLSHRNKGQYFGLDPKTGKTVWTSQGRQTENAALIARGENVFSLTTDSELILFKATPKSLETVRKYTVANSPTWAHPVVLGNRILVKDKTTLALWSAE